MCDTSAVAVCLLQSEAENAEREKAMYEEDIDAILERAEVVDTSAVRQ